MEKTVAYVVVAVLLGIVAMLPVIVLTSERADQGYYAFGGEANLMCDVEKSRLQEEFGLAKVPLAPFNLGLMITLSFVFALGVSLYFKRRIS